MVHFLDTLKRLVHGFSCPNKIKCTGECLCVGERANNVSSQFCLSHATESIHLGVLRFRLDVKSHAH
jgi:hypothetical protein